MLDSHHHFWKYTPAEYPWITSNMEALQHDHLLPELENDLDLSGIHQVISIQTRCSDTENKFLLAQAHQSNGLVTAIIGWAPLSDHLPDLRIFLDQYIHEPLLKGIRQPLINTPDEAFLTNNDFDEGLDELTHRDLTFDLLISHDQLPSAIKLVDRHPDLRIVLNHCGNPPITSNSSSHSWARNIRELARRPHVFCKLSGLTSGISNPPHLASALFRPTFETVLNAFTPSRIMFGSAWPICNLTTTYPAWLNIVDDLIYQLSQEEQNSIREETALNFYRIS